ncbi:hypothetical protein JNW90_32610 [Micromonospora sp. STR1s_5]|nr:hypothetical protein [Micromonospora sp. STR1s_5]
MGVMDQTPLTWTRDEVASVPLRRFTARSGEVEVGYVEYDGGNRMWVWSSPLAEDAWGWGADETGAKQGLETWLANLAAELPDVLRGGMTLLAPM